MSIGTGFCCVKCQTYLIALKNEVHVLETFEDGISPYKLWMADLFICPDCNFRMIGGFGRHNYDEHYTATFSENLRKVTEAGLLFTIKGCPRGMISWDGETN